MDFKIKTLFILYLQSEFNWILPMLFICFIKIYNAKVKKIKHLINMNKILCVIGSGAYLESPKFRMQEE